MSDSAIMASASNQPDNSQGQEEKMSAVELAYKDQGYHEMEFTTGDEIELKIKRETCKKNPGHPTFIMAREFTIDHLPEYWRDSLVFDYITARIGMTVRLAVKYTSELRPPNYPLSHRRGKYDVTAYGSGWVNDVSRKFTEKDGRTCPCKKCQESPHLAKTQWGEFFVHTARHVVYDDSEARHTRCDLFFDSDNNYNCPKVEGMKVVSSHTKGDSCYMSCISHDEDVCSKLEEMCNRCKKLRDEMRKKYKKRLPELVDKKKTVVVISHPHGLCKQVTVGVMTHTPRTDDVWDRYKYSAETCPGSSGGLVCVLEDLNSEVSDYVQESEYLLGVTWLTTHSGCQQKGDNECITATMLWI